MENEFYLRARREWDERYGDLVLEKRNWQITSAGLMLLSLVLAFGIVWMGARRKVIPYDHQLERGIDDRARFFRIEVLLELGRAFDIGKQRGHRLALAFELRAVSDR